MDEGETFNLMAALGLDAHFDAGQIVFSRANGATRRSTGERSRTPTGSRPTHRCEVFGIAEVATRGRDQRTRKRIDFRAEERKRKAVLNRGPAPPGAVPGGRRAAGVTAGTGVDHAVLHANGQGGATTSYAGVGEPSRRRALQPSGPPRRNRAGELGAADLRESEGNRRHRRLAGRECRSLRGSARLRLRRHRPRPRQTLA